MDAQGGRIADALRHPGRRGQLDGAAAWGTVDVERRRQDPAGALALSGLMKTPGVHAQHGEAERLAPGHRRGPRRARGPLAALGPGPAGAPARWLLNIAIDHWTASDGTLDLDDLIDEAFGASHRANPRITE